MNSDFCADVMCHLALRGLEVGDAPTEVQRWLDTLNLDDSLVTFLASSWVQESAEIGPLRLTCSREMAAGGDDAERLLAHRLLLVGSAAANGDLLVLDLTTRTARPAYVSHEVFWGDPEVDPRRHLQPIALSLDALLWRLAEERYLPTDYSAAEGLNEVLRKERLPRTSGPGMRDAGEG